MYLYRTAVFPTTSSNCTIDANLTCRHALPAFDQTVAVLMKHKERAADIGKAERRVLQPQVARRMARMNATNKAKFEKQVQQEVERVVYAAKRRYVRRQEKLDEAGVFHPEANAHRCVPHVTARDMFLAFSP